jgi:hypothetical protein
MKQCRMIPVYSPDGTSLGFRTLDAAQRLVASGHVRPAYGRKGHLKGIWLLRDDGSSPVQSRARVGTRYSFIESLDNGRCWQLRRLGRRGSTAGDVSPVSARDPFLRVIQDCIAPSLAAPSNPRRTTAPPSPFLPQPSARHGRGTARSIHPAGRAAANDQ